MTVVYPPGSQGECRWCHAPVLWLLHVRTGKKAPIDLEPVPEGNVLVDPDGIHYSIKRPGIDGLPGAPRHLNHWMTCPNATHLRPAVAAERP